MEKLKKEITILFTVLESEEIKCGGCVQQKWPENVSAKNIAEMIRQAIEKVCPCTD